MYDPVTDEVSVLVRNLWFANGVGVDKDETYVVVAETFRLSLLKYHLAGEKAGTTEYIAKGAPSPACT
jgi:sugar lactone lactonase YvrE